MLKQSIELGGQRAFANSLRRTTSLSMATDKTYRVELTNSAERDLKKLKGHQQTAALEALGTLEIDPMRGHSLDGNLKGVRSLAFTVRGSGQFRAAYMIDDVDVVCIIFIVGPHQNFYRQAAKRLDNLNNSGELLKY